jgi:hypothetical protein
MWCSDICDIRELSTILHIKNNIRNDYTHLNDYTHVDKLEPHQNSGFEHFDK